MTLSLSDFVCENCGHLWIDHNTSQLDSDGDVFCDLCTERCINHGIDVTHQLSYYRDEDISRIEPWQEPGKV